MSPMVDNAQDSEKAFMYSAFYSDLKSVTDFKTPHYKALEKTLVSIPNIVKHR